MSSYLGSVECASACGISSTEYYVSFRFPEAITKLPLFLDIVARLICLRLAYMILFFQTERIDYCYSVGNL